MTTTTTANSNTKITAAKEKSTAPTSVARISVIEDGESKEVEIAT
jgi:hypothetical protein